MAAGGKRKVIKSITVQDFLDRYGEELELSIEHPDIGLRRVIEEPAVNRPGLALSGFFDYFANKRIQVLGNSEISYLEKLSDELRVERFTKLCDKDFPCLIVAREHVLHPQLRQIARNREIAVIDSPRPTMSILNAATIKLENEFAPRTILHGCMVDYRGIGVLIIGKSGSGKSETAIGLLEKGAALVADDVVNLKQVGGDLSASAKDFARGYLEMRGIGIINVANLYGLSAIRPEKRLDLVVDLKPATDLNKVDRLGISQKKIQILDVEVPLVEIPVAAGRDTARLIGVAALDLQLRRIGYDMADEFNQRLLAQMNPG
ncbi:MAG: HPr kinase/phosphorylase [Paracoccaceae bacterium]|jgi:HPr kinase/phosphorylase